MSSKCINILSKDAPHNSPRKTAQEETIYPKRFAIQFQNIQNINLRFNVKINTQPHNISCSHPRTPIYICFISPRPVVSRAGTQWRTPHIHVRMCGIVLSAHTAIIGDQVFSASANHDYLFTEFYCSCNIKPTTIYKDRAI